MAKRRSFQTTALVLALGGAAVAAACGSSGSSSDEVFPDEADASVDVGSAGNGGIALPDSEGGTVGQGFDVTPHDEQTIDVEAGQSTPTIEYMATLDGHPINAGWSLDRGSVGAVAPGPADSTTFVPTGAAGGRVTISARLNDQTVTRTVFVKLDGAQNGFDSTKPGHETQHPADVGDLKAGGGVGGVGGEGLGDAVIDSDLLTALENPVADGSAEGLKLLYPYDKTVWPRGMLAPLLMWDWQKGDADAVQIELSTASGSYHYAGTFGRPPILAKTGGKFIRHPIPADAWAAATDSADGAADQVTLRLTIAKDGHGYGPLTQTWTIAPARLSGTVYYNSYGTQLVKNYTIPDKAGHSFGAAILGVRSGDTGPTLVVGKDSPLNSQGKPTNNSGCRVCHVVASRGRWMVTQADGPASYLYDLKAADVQGSAKTLPKNGVFAWLATTGEGEYALTNTVNPSSWNWVINETTSSYWQFAPDPKQETATGLPSKLAAGYPSYSPDDKHITYIDVTGSTNNVQGPLVAGDYDEATHTFANLKTLAKPAKDQRLGFPVYLPDNGGILFETQVRRGKTDSVVVTRDGARSELWWVNATGEPKPVPLATLNGKSGGATYLPSGPNSHGQGPNDPRLWPMDEKGLDDTTLNYEPTVLPISVGGYAWVVFTSRRLYGNQLTALPWQSAPNLYDTQDLEQATVKKIWVAAIDLNAPPGTDPSHPAFYLPAQEILAGNSRGFWVLDPCHADGTSCETGDQCCGGYCEPNGEGGALVCANAPPTGECSKAQEKCTTVADCCDPSSRCINGFCAQKGVQ